jgi:hypothetical protein
MPCACKDKNGTRFQVVMNGGLGRIAWTSGSGATAQTTAARVAERYPGSVVRKVGTQEIVHHAEKYEVVTEGGKGVVVFAHADQATATGELVKHQGAIVRERETGLVVAGTVPADAPAAAALTKE